MRHKYGAVPTVTDGIRFPSKKEARRYGALKLLLQAGAITELELQPRYTLHGTRGEPVCVYVADFRYHDGTVIVVEDCKGFLTPLFKLKKKLFEQEYQPLLLT
jgi:hypothetical protein